MPTPIAIGKIQVVREYLQQAFSEHEIADMFDGTHSTQSFRVTTRGALYLLRISREHLDDNSHEYLAHELRNRDVAAFLREHHRVLLTSAGLQVLPAAQ